MKYSECIEYYNLSSNDESSNENVITNTICDLTLKSENRGIHLFMDNTYLGTVYKGIDDEICFCFQDEIIYSLTPAEFKILQDLEISIYGLAVSINIYNYVILCLILNDKKFQNKLELNPVLIKTFEDYAGLQTIISDIDKYIFHDDNSALDRLKKQIDFKFFKHDDYKKDSEYFIKYCWKQINN